MNCTGYGFDVSLTLCSLGAVGDGNIADLEVTISTGFIFGSTLIPGWDGSELAIDLISEAGVTVSRFNTDNDACDVNAAVLTLIPDPGGDPNGMAMLDITITNCDGPPMMTTSVPDVTTSTTTLAPNQYVDDLCGPGGTYVLSEMIPFALTGPPCK